MHWYVFHDKLITLLEELTYTKCVSVASHFHSFIQHKFMWEHFLSKCKKPPTHHHVTKIMHHMEYDDT